LLSAPASAPLRVSDRRPPKITRWECFVPVVAIDGRADQEDNNYVFFFSEKIVPDTIPATNLLGDGPLTAFGFRRLFRAPLEFRTAFTGALKSHTEKSARSPSRTTRGGPRVVEFMGVELIRLSASY